MVKYVVMDSVIFLENGILALAAKGVYCGALANKRRNCPKQFLGDLINRNFTDNEVGGVDMF